MKQNIMLLLHLHNPYIKKCTNVDENALIYEKLFNAISFCYIPLLQMLDKLLCDKVDFNISLVITPELCSILHESEIRALYKDWLRSRIALGKKELERLKNNEELKQLATSIMEKAQQDLIHFHDRYQEDIIGSFTNLAKNSNIKLVATCATDTLLPHIAHSRELLNAQIEAGLISHKHFFGTISEGFYLPHLGYANGIERNLGTYGVNYTIVDSHSFLFSKQTPEDGTFTPVRTANGVCFFARDFLTKEKLYSSNCYAKNPLYLNKAKDIAYELDSNDLSPFIKGKTVRVASGYKYYCNDNNHIYNEEQALNQAKSDAKDFVNIMTKRLQEASRIIDKQSSITCIINEDILGTQWIEGITWLDTVIREIASSDSIQTIYFQTMLQDGKQFNLQKMTLYNGADSGLGYCEDLVDSTNAWMKRHLFKAGQRMVELADRFTDKTGLKARLLNLGATQLLLAQSSCLPQAMHDGKSLDFAKHAFIEYINNFSCVFDALGSNTVSTEWLIKMENKYLLFPWMSYKIFSRKK